MRKSTIAALSIAAAGFALPAAAQMNMSAFYAGVGIGQSKAKDWCSGAGGISCDDKDTAWKVFGGYQFSRNFAAEFGYVKLGEFNASTGGLTDTAFPMMLRNTWDSLVAIPGTTSSRSLLPIASTRRGAPSVQVAS